MKSETKQLWSMTSLLQALGDLLVDVKGRHTDMRFGPILTDSRRLIPGAVFVALKGASFDGHDYALSACDAGAGVLILERSVGAPCPEIIVKDTALAYGALARAWRSQYAVPVICVVGSNGKTTTTQMIASILRAACGDECVVATQKNYNNGIGVPMTLLGFNAHTKAAVVEAGINHPGEMAQLVNWIRPTVVVMTNAQREHQEFLDGVEGAARENGMAIVALSAKGTAVLPQTDACLPIWQQLACARGCRVVSYAAEAPADVSARRDTEGMHFTSKAGVVNAALQMPGRHVLHDATAAVAAAQAIGVRSEAIECALSAFRPVSGRGVVHRLRNGAVLIDEAYNANPDSMRAAIDVLADMPEPRLLVLGDMGEVGDRGVEFHREIGLYAKERGINRLLAVGPLMREAVDAFGSYACHFESVESLEKAVAAEARQGGNILVKASNFMKLSELVRKVVDADGVFRRV